MEICPHCGNQADVEPHALLNYRCRICGGPRVYVDASNVKRSGRELPLLKEAQRLRARRAAWMIGAGLSGATAAGLSLVVLAIILLAGTSAAVTLAMLAAAAVPWIATFFSARRASQARAALKQAVSEARSLVAADVVASFRPELSAQQLSKIMKLSEAEAELVLAEADIDAYLRVDAPQLRVDPGDAEELAELEQQARELRTRGKRS